MTSPRPFDEALKMQIRALGLRYPDPRGAMIPALHKVQEARGLISPDDCRELAELTGIPAVKWWETVCFYTMFRREGVGRYVIGVCMNVSCSLLGSRHLLDHLRERLGVAEGEVTPDGLFSYERVECLCCCGGAPAITVNDASFQHLTDEKLDRLIAQLKGGADPHELSPGLE